MTLIERIESAAVGSRELDAEIHAYVHGGYVEHSTQGPREFATVWGEDRGLKKAPISGFVYRDRDLICDARQAPHYTTSLDAAMQLVPANSRWEVNIQRDKTASFACVDDIETNSKAATPALALCAAALRAREMKDD